jgi:GrpB-like predicted nucleotidyltransferase (UPF0157 family)
VGQLSINSTEVVWPVIVDLARTIEHVGSSAVPGLAAKPIIDLDVVIRAAEELMPDPSVESDSCPDHCYSVRSTATG